MKGWAAVLAGLLALLPAAPAPGIEKKPLSMYAREVWTTRDGLPHNQINGVAQTREGYLWFATWGGLVRYNGQDFRIYGRQNVPQLLDNGIRNVTTGPSGALIVATSRGGVSVLRGERWQNYSRRQGLTQNETATAIEDRSGRIWVATENSGVDRVSNGQVRRFSVAQGLANDRSYALLQDGNGAVWVGTGGGVSRIEGERIQNFDARDGLPAGAVFSIAAAPRGGIYVGTQHGVYVGENGRFRPLVADFPDEAVVSLVVDAEGALWLGTVNRGLLRYNEGRVEMFDAAGGLPNNRVASLFADREGSLWVGTNAGLMRFADTPFITLDSHNGLSDDYVRALMQDAEGTVWIGTARGLNRWRAGQMLPPLAGGKATDQVLSLADDGEGGVWAGMYSNGLVHWRDGAIVEALRRDRGELPGDQVRAVELARDGSLWIGTTTGLGQRKDGKLREFRVADGLPREYIFALHQAQDGRMWVGTANGAAVVDADGKVTALDFFALDEAQDVFGIHEDADGTLWFATDRGLVRYRNGKLALLGVHQGLPVDTIFEVVGDSYGNFWLTSNSGVIHVRRDVANAALDGRRQTIDYQQFTEADGMASAQCNGGAGPAALRAQDGSIWVATARGVAVVQPDQLPRYELEAPQVVIEGIRVDGTTADGDRTLVLPAGTRKLELDYVSLSYRAPEQIRYRYKLEGFDNDWVERNQMRNAQYTNLPPGRYKFQVSAALRGSGWSPETATLNFEIQPRIWQRPWFLPLAGLLGALFLYGLYRARVANLEARERELSSIVAERTRDLSVKNDQLEDLNRTIRRQSEDFELQARTDALTGLANRRSMDERLDAAFRDAIDRHAPLSFALLDLDHFKRINDQYSHDVGDRALRLVASVMARELGEERVARWGGEEFALLFPNQDLAAAVALCERLRRAIEAADCQDLAPGLKITASIGIADRTGLAHHEKLVSRADTKLYEAKHSGRNRVVS
jgi:diguanylate cyclase (GGDEF)-like protein